MLKLRLITRPMTAASIGSVVILSLIWAMNFGGAALVANFGLNRVVAAHLSIDREEALLSSALTRLHQADAWTDGASFRIRRSLGMAQWFAGDIDNAIAGWNQIPDISPEMVIWGNRARYRGDIVQALRWYDAAARILPHPNSSISLNRGLAYWTEGDEDALFRDIEQATAVDSGWADEQERFLGWYHWGRLLHLHGRNAEAEAALRTALEVLPSNIRVTPDMSVTIVSEAHRYLGLTLLVRDQTSEAVNEMKKSVQINPNNPWAHLHYGKALYYQDPRRIAPVQQAFLQAMALRPNDRDLQENVIGFWRSVGQDEAADSLCSLARKAGIKIENHCR